MFDLKDKTALVTGASGGIGNAIAKALHAQGCKLVISGTRRKKLEELAKELGSNVFIETCNLSLDSEVEGLIDKAVEHLGQVDILVCNAGITKDSLILRMTLDVFKEVLNINLTSSFILNKAAAKKMMKQKWGRIINISSIVGFTGNAGQANYTASKSGLVGMSKTFAQEFAKRGVTVNCIAPGFISTPMTDKLNDEQKEAMRKNIPTGTFGKPENIASAVVYLASNEAEYVTGQTIHVNGGMLMD